jgi:hypothetical protein
MFIERWAGQPEIKADRVNALAGRDHAGQNGIERKADGSRGCGSQG